MQRSTSLRQRSTSLRHEVVYDAHACYSFSLPRTLKLLEDILYGCRYLNSISNWRARVYECIVCMCICICSIWRHDCSLYECISLPPHRVQHINIYAIDRPIISMLHEFWTLERESPHLCWHRSLPSRAGRRNRL